MKRTLLALLLLTLCGVSQAQAPVQFVPFDLAPAQITERCDGALARAETRFKDLAALKKEERTFSNTVAAFDAAGWDMLDELLGIANLKDVSTDKAVRDASRECDARIDAYDVEIYSREELFQALQDYAARGEPLEGEDKRLLEMTLLEYKRNGFGLPPETRLQVKELKQSLVQLQQDFQKNLGEVTDSLAISTAETAGLPQDFVDRLEKLPDGRLKVTLDYPDYIPFMRNSLVPDARRRLEGLFNNRGSTENVRLFEAALVVRHRVAGLLGYPSHAAYVLEDRMAKDPATVKAFLERLRGRLSEQAKAELEVLVAMKREVEGPDAEPRINAWDFGFYDNRLMKTKYSVDEEKVKEYFPLDAVLGGMFKIYQTLLGVKFEQVKGAPVWHPDVQLFLVTEAKTGEEVGHFYMDLFPREGKYKHAHASTVFQGRALADGSYRKPVKMIVANFNKPTAEAPSLLKHSEVETLFHEFGHIMHGVLTKARFGRFAGTQVSRDFVEAPSQMLENWVWDKHMLKAISAHHKDRSKKLPSDMIERMIAAKNMNAGLRYSRQLFFATVDQAYHNLEGLKSDGSLPFDTTETYAKLMAEIARIPMSPGTHPQASFGHLMGGYDSGYYGYLWSEVYASDMFARFEKEGVLDADLGRAYRETILAPGRSKDEAGQLKLFLGREPNEDAFFKSIGLKAAPAGNKG